MVNADAHLLLHCLASMWNLQLLRLCLRAEPGQRWGTRNLHGSTSTKRMDAPAPKIVMALSASRLRVCPPSGWNTQKETFVPLENSQETLGKFPRNTWESLWKIPKKQMGSLWIPRNMTGASMSCAPQLDPVNHQPGSTCQMVGINQPMCTYH